MKKSLYLFIALLSTTSLFAAEPVKPCDPQALQFMSITIEAWKAKGYSEVKLMKNPESQTLGFYAWTPGEDKMYSEICEITNVSSQWTTWENREFKTNPAQWQKDATYVLVEDSGIAQHTLLDPSASGDVITDLKILSVDGNQSHIVREEIVQFVNP